MFSLTGLLPGLRGFQSWWLGEDFFLYVATCAFSQYCSLINPISSRAASFPQNKRAKRQEVKAASPSTPMIQTGTNIALVPYSVGHSSYRVLSDSRRVDTDLTSQWEESRRIVAIFDLSHILTLFSDLFSECRHFTPFWQLINLYGIQICWPQSFHI